MKCWSLAKTVLGFLFVTAAVACSDSSGNISIPLVHTIPPSPPHSARSFATFDSGKLQKLQFFDVYYFDQRKRVWMTQYFSLPPKWNAVQLEITADSSRGIIEVPDGRRIRWLAGLVGGPDLDRPNTEVIWKRRDVDASVTYGVIRRASGVREFQAGQTGPAAFIFSAPASSEPFSDIVTFITPITIAAPCKDCVVPGPRK